VTISINDLIPVLQTAIGPVILISGVGLLLLSMTNRLGRVIDRSRALARDRRNAAPQDRERLSAQLLILSRRSELIRRAILFASISVLLAALLVMVLFFTALIALENAWLISLLFMGCMASLILSLIAFIQDINLALHALKREVGEIIDE